jgi:hypothetical protein
MLMGNGWVIGASRLDVKYSGILRHIVERGGQTNTSATNISHSVLLRGSVAWDQIIVASTAQR